MFCSVNNNVNNNGTIIVHTLLYLFSLQVNLGNWAVDDRSGRSRHPSLSRCPLIPGLGVTWAPLVLLCIAFLLPRAVALLVPPCCSWAWPGVNLPEVSRACPEAGVAWGRCCPGCIENLLLHSTVLGPQRT